MRDSRLLKLAKLLVHYALRITAEDLVLIRGSVVSEPLICELFRELVETGANVEILPVFDWQKEILIKTAKEEQIRFASPALKRVIEECSVLINILGSTNLKAMSSADSQKLVWSQGSMADILQIADRKEKQGKFRWCNVPFPTDAQAQAADMSFYEYEDFVFGALLLNEEQPANAWKRMSREQEKLVRYLDSKKELHILSENTDLKLSINGRKWINCDGKSNLPDGEVMTAPIEDSTHGFIRFSFPGIYSGREISGIFLEFSEGNVIRAEAENGRNLLDEILSLDDGARRLGEVAIGTNYGISRYTRNILFDEKIGGTIHLALGSSINGTGGVNQSCIHWDLIRDMRKESCMYADGELFYKDGRILNDVMVGI